MFKHVPVKLGINMIMCVKTPAFILFRNISNEKQMGKFARFKGKKFDNNIHSTKNEKHHRGKQNINKMMKNGSERDKEWAKIIMLRAAKVNPKGFVNCIDTRTGKVFDKKITDCYRDLDLDEYNVVSLPYKEDEAPQRLIVKIVKRDVAMTEFKNYKASVVTEQLRAAGSTIIAKQEESRRNANEKKGVKNVQISWGISENDLKGQKTFEILNHLEKGVSVQIRIDDKKVFELRNIGRTVESRKSELDDLQIMKRNKSIDYLRGLFEEKDVQIVKEEVDISSNVYFEIKSKKKIEMSKDEKKEQKRLEKESRKEKMRQKQLEKEQRIKSMKEISA